MTATITAAAIKADGIPEASKVTNDELGREYLAAATKAARSAQGRVAKGQADLALVFHQVKTSGIARFGLDAEQLEAADDDGRSTGFSLWYRSLGVTMQEADKLANFGRYLASGLPVANVGQARAIIALENAGENDQAWREEVRQTVADIYADEGKVTAAAIKAKGREALGIESAPSSSKVVQPEDQRPGVKVETLADVAAIMLHDVTAAASMVAGDLSGYSAAEWKAFQRTLSDLTAAADEYRLAADRKGTAPTV